MKKILFAVAVLFSFSIILTSCNKEDVYSKKIVGTWQSEKFEYYQNGQLVDTIVAIVDVVFTADGKWHFSNSQGVEYTYYFEGNTLYMGGLDGFPTVNITSCTVKTFTSSQLIIEFTQLIDGKKFNIIWYLKR